MYSTRDWSLPQSGLLRGLGLALALAPIFAAGASAQENYTFSVAALGSLGGSFDAEPGDSIDNVGYQLNLSMVTQPRTHVGIRLGQLALDSDPQFGNLFDAELSYGTIAGEYRYRHSFYESGLFLGLGAYRLEGTNAAGVVTDETSVGATVGATGEFQITRWLSLLVELSGHYVDFDDQQLFATVQGGFVVHF